MKILVVDDDQVSRDTLAEMLRRFEYEVLTASNGREALETLAGNDCRMVISDWIMPEVNGLTLCRAIREGEFSSYIYIILLTVRHSRQDVIEGLSAGADDFIKKPFNPGELRVRLGTGERILSLETRDLTLFEMARLAESRDPDMAGHVDRIRHYARALGEHLATQPKFRGVIDGEYLRLLYLTAPLYDIGKVAIKESILLKEGKLTPQEYDVMKTHTVKGAEAIEAALTHRPEAAFLRMARDVALTHHERYDGTGYPQGLAGEQIPLCGRIVGLADAYDAMTSKRVYREAVDHAKARLVIVKESGRQFDPDVVEAFLAAESDFITIGNCLAERSLVPA
ncbi:MAG TPA: HD domain-containing phosphohydrolase [Pirellulales bacterium]|nr:HD domain-containing phosphohydrolase [Pirellulales bacterium]